MASSSNKMVLLSGNEAVAKGDYEFFLDLCTEDTTWVFIGDQVLNGKEAVRSYMQVTYLAPPEVTVTRLIEEEDMLVVTGEITLKDRDGIAKKYAYSDVWKFRDGKMAELKAYVVEVK